jgi:ketosteroid isomerase-like protein
MLRRTLASIAVVLALLCSYSGMSGARMTADGSQERALRELEAKWLSAEDDPNALESILADDFVHVLSVGFVTKREQLSYLRSHPSPDHEPKHFETLRIRVFGNFGIANGIVARTEADGTVHRTMFTDVFAERGGKWQAVNAQELSLAAAAPAGGESDANFPPNLRTDVSRANQDWITGLETGNIERIVSSYSRESIFCGATGDCVTGTSAIAALYKARIAKFGRATSASVHSEALHADDDVAYESGYGEAQFANGSVSKGRFSTVWKQQPDGHWKIFRNMSLP